MIRATRFMGGLIGRVVAILLATVLIEFLVSTILYERASQFSVRDDEARRLAEHLVIARRIIADYPPPQRPALAAELTTNRYAVEWGQPVALPAMAPSLDGMRRQVVEWEPSLASADLRLKLTSPGRSSVVTGALRLPDQSWLHFRTLEPLANIDLGVERVLLALAPAVALMMLGGLLVGQTLRPLRSLTDAADRLGGSGGPQVQEGGPAEIRRVIAAFNRMQARIGRLITDRTQALAAVGHDLRTPLARLRLRADAITDDRLRESIAVDVMEMEAMIASLLAFLGGDSDPEAPVVTDVAVLVGTLVDDAADRGGDVSYRGPAHVEASIRAWGLRRALTNLIDNALHHAEQVTVALAVTAERLTVTVEDNGPGIPADALERVLDPFVRLDVARRRDTPGFGLGLAIVKRAAESDGGRLLLANRAEGGLAATIDLPRR